MNSFIVFFFFAATVFAHFDVVEPKARTVDEATSETVPCGGSNIIGFRTKVPVQGLLVATTIYHKGTKLQYKIAVVENPQTQADFRDTFSPDFVVEKASTIRTQALDFSSVAGVANNVNATLQVYSKDSHSEMYQCIDVTFFKAASSSASNSYGSAVLFASIVGLLI